MRQYTAFLGAAAIKGMDYFPHVLADRLDFRDLNALTGQIERGTLLFIEDVEGFLTQHEG